MKVITFGRNNENDVVIPDEHASRHHMQIIQHDDGRFSLSDFGSTNGTFVNGRRVSGTVPLSMNDVVRIGNTTVQWQMYFGPVVPGSNPVVPGSNPVVPGSDVTNPKPKKTGLWWGIGAAAAAAVIAVMAILLFSSGKKVEAGETFSYTQKIKYEGLNEQATSWFVFTSPTEVVWLLGVTADNMYPIGFGEYIPSKGLLVFSSSHKLNKYIELYYDVDSIAFQFAPGKKTMRVLETGDDAVDEFLNSFFNKGKECTLDADRKRFLKKDLVGSKWESYVAEYSDGTEEYIGYVEDEDKSNLVFVSEKEVLIDGEPRGYVFIDNIVSIKYRGHIRKKNLIGFYTGGGEMRLCRKDLGYVRETHCVTLQRTK